MVSDLAMLAHKGCKIAAAKKVFYSFFHLFALFKPLFAPISQSSIYKLFRFSESLGKSNAKKCSQNTKFSQKGCKIAAQKKCFLANFALLAGFFWYWCYYPLRSSDALFPVCGIFFQMAEQLLIAIRLFNSTPFH